MQMNTGFDGSMIDQLLETAEDKKENEEELEIERKYYKKPDPATDPLQAGNFLRGFVQGMMQKMDNISMFDDENLDFVRDFLIAKGYNKLIPKSLQDKYQREADIEKYLKNMDKLRQRGILS